MKRLPEQQYCLTDDFQGEQIRNFKIFRELSWSFPKKYSSLSLNNWQIYQFAFLWPKEYKTEFFFLSFVTVDVNKTVVSSSFAFWTKVKKRFTVCKINFKTNLLPSGARKNQRIPLLPCYRKRNFPQLFGLISLSKCRRVSVVERCWFIYPHTRSEKRDWEIPQALKSAKVIKIVVWWDTHSYVHTCARPSFFSLSNCLPSFLSTFVKVYASHASLEAWLLVRYLPSNEYSPEWWVVCWDTWLA